jgi:hypothetical protein
MVKIIWSRSKLQLMTIDHTFFVSARFYSLKNKPFPKTPIILAIIIFLRLQKNQCIGWYIDMS